MASTIVRKAGRAAGFLGLTVVSGVGVAVGLRVASGAHKWAVRDRVTADWSKGLLKLFGVELVLGGAAPGSPGVGRGQGRVVVANHRSIIDIAVLLSTFGGAVLSRADLATWPIMGPAARAAGTIFVDRGDRASGQHAIAQMVARLADHDTICLFPEGTTYADDEVRAFKPGGFVAAARANVPVVPVGIAYPTAGAGFGDETFLQHLGRLAETKRTVAHVEIGAPMSPTQGEETGAFGERCREEVARLVGVARSRHARLAPGSIGAPHS